MNNKALKEVAVAFAEWIKEECFFNIKGYVIRDIENSPEYEVDELFDYWVNAVVFE